MRLWEKVNIYTHTNTTRTHTQYIFSSFTKAVLEFEYSFFFLILGVNYQLLSSFHRLWITMELSRTNHTFLPPERSRHLIDDDDDDEFELAKRLKNF